MKNVIITHPHVGIAKALTRAFTKAGLNVTALSTENEINLLQTVIEQQSMPFVLITDFIDANGNANLAEKSAKIAGKANVESCTIVYSSLFAGEERDVLGGGKTQVQFVYAGEPKSDGKWILLEAVNNCFDSLSNSRPF